MATLFVSDHTTEEWIEHPEYKTQAYSQINNYILVQNILMSVVGVITMIFVRPAPPNPPSISAFNRLSMVGEAPLKTQLK